MKSTCLSDFKSNPYKKSIQDFFKKKPLFNLLLFGLSFLAFFIAFYIKKDLIHVRNLSYYQLKTAMNLINGDLFWPGPEVPFLDHYFPGPLMSFLLSPPLLLSSTPYSSSLIWMIGWLSMTYSIAVVFTKSICKDSSSVFFFFLLLLTSPFLSNSILHLEWNRIFSLLFHLLLLIFIYRWKQNENEIYLPFIGLTIGLGLQLDYSILFHLLTLTMFFITSEKVQNSLPLKDPSQTTLQETKSFQWKYAFACITLILLPQIPYLLAYGNDKIDLLKPNWYQIHWFIQDFLYQPLERLEDIARAIDFNKERLFQLSPLLTLLFYRFLFKKDKVQEDECLINLTPISICPLFFIIISNNGFYFLNLGLLFLIAKYHDQLLPKNPALKTLLFSFYGVSLITSLSFSLLIFLNFIFLLGILLLRLKSLFRLRFNHPFFSNLLSLFNRYFVKTRIQNPRKQEIPASTEMTALTENKSYLKIFLYLLNPTLIFTFFLIYYFHTLSNQQFEGKSIQLKKLMSFVYEETGWSKQAALSRIFTVGFKNQNISLAFPYLLAEERNKKNSWAVKNTEREPLFLYSPHGGDFKKHTHTTHTTHTHQKRQNKVPLDIIHSSHYPANSAKYTDQDNRGYFIIEKDKKKKGINYKKQGNIRNFLLETTLPNEVKKEIKSDKLKIQKSPYQETKEYVLISYLTTTQSQFPFGFHNVSTTDSNYKSDWFEENCYSNVLYKREDHFYLCYLMDSYLEFIGIKLNFLKLRKKNFLIVEVNSPPLSIIKANRVIPHSFLMNLNIHLSCKKEESQPIIERIGLSNNKDFNKSFFAPITIKKITSCSLKSLEKITISFSHQRKYLEPTKKTFELKL